MLSVYPAAKGGPVFSMRKRVFAQWESIKAFLKIMDSIQRRNQSRILKGEGMKVRMNIIRASTPTIFLVLSRGISQ